MQKTLRLPIGISSFSRMIEGNFIYIDKTKYIKELIDEGECYFLSRPRRFGKSLLVSTFSQLFKGNKELFNSLYITTTNYDWATYPIIYLSLSARASRTAQDLQRDLSWKLENIANDYSIDISDIPYLQSKFEVLVKRLSVQNKVVILVDEYDYPLINNINNVEVAKACRDVLHDFFAVLKDLGDYIRFIFITGVTRFSKTSIFSGLNNLDDLTMSKSAALLLGYTKEEITLYFDPYLKRISDTYSITEETILEQIKTWYNGYQFALASPTDELDLKVYNPTSVLSYLKEGQIANYWFTTGTPTFLMHLIKTQEYPIPHIEGAQINVEEAAKTYEIDNLPLIPLLLQTGYLTLEKYNPLTKNYTLTYPNEEVKVSFLHFIMSQLTETNISFLANNTVTLSNALKQNNLPLFFQTLEIFFANIPYTLQLPYEKYYQTIFYSILSLMGVYIHAEVATNDGRIDATIETASYLYIFEFKLNGSAEAALNQIKEKKYYQKYLHLPKKIILVGVEFDTEKRNVAKWAIENYSH